ncbi:HsdR2 (fragment) [Desulfamplus magnetovallimortis]|uniref:type I site-specific deoxyribonuclease n=1 Tax=Desulfamplus magnetovallimortis TaxID=1246637 RepID=A0A1W1H927_9BACT
MTTLNPEYLQSELPAIQLFEKLGYTYQNGSTNDERSSINDVILENRLKDAIKRLNPWLNENNVNNAFKEITSVSATSFIEANEHIHKLISTQEYTPKQIIDGKETYRGVSYIDFINIENNDFLIVNQMKFKGKEKNSIPDLAVFVNGLPLAVIECKSPTAQGAFSDCVNDLIYYQINSEKLFRYNQVCVGIYKVGGKYGAVGAKEVHYQHYKSDETQDIEALLERDPTHQDILIYNLFEKEKFLDLIRNFVILSMAINNPIQATSVKHLKKLLKDDYGKTITTTIQKFQEVDEDGNIIKVSKEKIEADGKHGFNRPEKKSVSHNLSCLKSWIRFSRNSSMRAMKPLLWDLLPSVNLLYSRP